MKASAKKAETIRGNIDKIFYASPLFSAGRLLTDEGEFITFAGKFQAKANEPVILTGGWTEHPSFGRQFKVDFMEHNMDFDQEGLISYLAAHPDIKGIGPSRARALVEKYGETFEETLLEHPEQISKEAGLAPEMILNLRDTWIRNRSVNSIMSWLSSFGITHNQASKLVEKLGNNCMNVLKEDPYILVREIKGFGFKKVDDIARKLGTPKEHPSRIRSGIVCCVEENLDLGNCWIEWGALVKFANMLLIMDSPNSRELIELELEELLEDGTLSFIEDKSGRLVALTKVLDKERYLTDVFLNAGTQSPHDARIPCSEDISADMKSELNRRQKDAVLCSFQYSITLISGGAGSGKSFTISEICRLAGEYGLRVTLCAPTGKAAKRMEELSGSQAQTIHRLLGYDGKCFSKGAHDHIDTDILIVDEFSMVDIFLAWQLMTAIAFNRTSLIIVGDHNQLPPVGPGNILRDLINTQAIPTVILDQVVRQAGVLKENSTAILEGQIKHSVMESEDGRPPWIIYDQFRDEKAARKHLEYLLINKIESYGYDLIRDVQILTPTHKGELGTKALNEMLQALLQKHLFNITVLPVEPGRRPPFLKHDKVMQTRNNYDLNIMNGAIGYVIDVTTDGDIIIDFDGRPITFQKGAEALHDVQLAYAQTIYKVQGSEFPCTILMVHRAHSFMHHRNLLYTGVTRARTTCIMIGDRWGIHNCAGKCVVDKRKTFLSIFLERRMAEMKRDYNELLEKESLTADICDIEAEDDENEEENIWL